MMMKRYFLEISRYLLLILMLFKDSHLRPTGVEYECGT